MKIGEMFAKPINRDIKGVIKVGQHDEENRYQELDEYVVTKELAKHFSEFFDNYKRGIGNHTDEMGVWISGFFGSGKSHFLKILSYILDNNEAKGKRAIDFFKEDKKITDPIVLANMESAANTSTDVILFNIDAKSTGSQSKKDPILDVFMKVFNEMQGFCGDLPFLAELERTLASEGLFDSFKSEFNDINGNEWEKIREGFFFFSDDVVAALSKIDFMSYDEAKTWADKADENYSISIEKFANLVEEYCNSKGTNHHVIFLVDEIGQYIGDDSQLLLNLQTITEELGIKCKGRAWLIVTSQEDIDELVKVKRNDFSKIQARFKTRLSLSSSNVDEVIRKRILAKKETANQTLEALYSEKDSIIKNLITFSHDTAEKKMYADEKDFSVVYPFIPYQFDLLGYVLNSIRKHGASGKHLSEGERSMLALFQESAVSIMGKELGVLMPFNIFYNALHKFIDHTHSSVINKAFENQKLDDFDVEVLKVLFMVKYVKEIKANLENITTLMVDNIETDKTVLKGKIDKSLNRLVLQTLVQKNGEIFSFLTDEEQDINRAINQENVERGEILNMAASVIFDDILKNEKFRYSSRYNFPFNKSVDGIDKGSRQWDMGVQIITSKAGLKNVLDDSQRTISPLSEDEKISNILRKQSENNEVIVYLRNDLTFLEEIEGVIKINKYLIRQSADYSQTSKSIRDTKRDEASEKRDRIRNSLEKSLKTADIYVKGDKIDIKEKNPEDRINDALKKLVHKIYHRLDHMKTAPIQADIEDILNSVSHDNFGEYDNVENSLAIDDLNAFIKQETKLHAKPTLKTVINKFKKAPYGFVDLDIEWLVATLFAQKKIYLIKNGQNISLKTSSTDEIFNFLTKREFKDKILIDKKKEIEKYKIKNVKEILKDFFNVPNTPDDDESIMVLFQDKSLIKHNEIEKLLVEYKYENRYPGETVILKSLDLLRDINDINHIEKFFDFVTDKKEDFLDISYDFDAVSQFFKGPQKEIFKKACQVEDLFEKNKNYIDDSQLKDIVNNIKKIIHKDKPFSHIHELPELSSNFDSIHRIILDSEITPFKKEINDNLKLVLDELTSDQLKGKFKEKFHNEFSELEEKLINSQEISIIRGIHDEGYNLRNNCITEVNEFKDAMEETETTGVSKPKIRIKNLNITNISSKTRIKIEKEEDIDKFIESLREKLKDELEENTVIDLRI